MNTEQTLSEGQSLADNLFHLRNDPQTAIDAFGLEWVQMVGNSAANTIEQLQTRIAALESALGEQLELGRLNGFQPGSSAAEKHKEACLLLTASANEQRGEG